MTIVGYKTAAQISTPPTDITVNHNEQITLACGHIGDPTPLLVWTYSNQGQEVTIPNTLPYSIDASGTLYIERVSYADQGNISYLIYIHFICIDYFNAFGIVHFLCTEFFPESYIQCVKCMHIV